MKLFHRENSLMNYEPYLIVCNLLPGLIIIQGSMQPLSLNGILVIDDNFSIS